VYAGTITKSNPQGVATLRRAKIYRHFAKASLLWFDLVRGVALTTEPVIPEEEKGPGIA